MRVRSKSFAHHGAREGASLTHVSIPTEGADPGYGDFDGWFAD